MADVESAEMTRHFSEDELARLRAWVRHVIALRGNQAEAAKWLGLGQGHLSKLLSAQRRPGALVIKALEKRLHKSVAELCATAPPVPDAAHQAPAPRVRTEPASRVSPPAAAQDSSEIMRAVSSMLVDDCGCLVTRAAQLVGMAIIQGEPSSSELLLYRAAIRELFRDARLWDDGTAVRVRSSDDSDPHNH